MTVDAIHELIAEGAEMVMVTGGMSVDPDDRTPASIRAAAARVVSYGAPIFPAAMEDGEGAERLRLWGGAPFDAANAASRSVEKGRSPHEHHHSSGL